MPNDNVCEGHLLRSAALLEAALHHTAPVLVGSDLLAMLHASIEDELCVNRSDFGTFNIRVCWLLTRSERIQE